MRFAFLSGGPRRRLAAGATLLALLGGFAVAHERSSSAFDDCSPAEFVDAGAQSLMNEPAPPPSTDWVNPDALIAAVEAATADRRQWFAGLFHKGGVVHIGFTHDVDGARAEINAKVPDAKDVIVYSAPYTKSEIDEGMVAVQAFTAEGHVPLNSLAEDISRDRITVTMSAPTLQKIQQLHAVFGCIVNVVKGPPATNP